VSILEIEMLDKDGNEIKAGDKIKHVHHSQTVEVRCVDGVLYGGTVPISAYHSSVIELVKSTNR